MRETYVSIRLGKEEAQARERREVHVCSDRVTSEYIQSDSGVTIEQSSLDNDDISSKHERLQRDM